MEAASLGDVGCTLQLLRVCLHARSQVLMFRLTLRCRTPRSIAREDVKARRLGGLEARRLGGLEAWKLGGLGGLKLKLGRVRGKRKSVFR